MGNPTDDHGVKYTPVQPSAIIDDPRFGDARFRATFRRAGRTEKAERSSNHHWGILVGVLIMFPALFLVAIIPGIPSNWAPAVQITVVMGVAGVVERRLRVAGTKQTKHMLVHRGLCPCCLYSVGGLPPEGDGCVVCPECGLAWKSEQIVEPLTFEEGEAPTFAQQAVEGARSREWTQPQAIEDDRGEKGALVHPRLRSEIENAVDERRTRLVAARDGMCTTGILRRRIFVCGFIAWALIATVTFLWTPAAPTVMAPATIRMMVIMFTGLGWLYVLLMSGIGNSKYGVFTETVRGEMIQLDLCPFCAADLRGLDSEDDGCVVCRECEAAWRLGSDSGAVV